MENIGHKYAYKVLELNKDVWVYEIFSQHTKDLLLISKEWFHCRADAGLAAIGNIRLLEQGEVK